MLNCSDDFACDAGLKELKLNGCDEFPWVAGLLLKLNFDEFGEGGLKENGSDELVYMVMDSE